MNSSNYKRKEVKLFLAAFSSSIPTYTVTHLWWQLCKLTEPSRPNQTLQNGRGWKFLMKTLPMWYIWRLEMMLEVVMEVDKVADIVYNCTMYMEVDKVDRPGQTTWHTWSTTVPGDWAVSQCFSLVSNLNLSRYPDSRTAARHWTWVVLQNAQILEI